MGKLRRRNGGRNESLSAAEFAEARLDLWALLAVACFLYFTRSRNAPLKRQLWPYYNVVLGGFVVAVAILMQFP